MKINGTIYDYIREQENSYLKPITLEEGWDWSMKDHLRKSFLYKNSQFWEQNENRFLRPNKNIVLGIVNIAYRTEGFDVKDIELYVNNSDESYKSLVARKYHDKWALENQIDTFIDDLVVSYVDYGGVLVKDTSEGRPEVVNLRSLAFCNQVDLLDNPFAIKHKMSPAKLRTYDKWGQTTSGATCSIEQLIVLTKDEVEDAITIYEVHGTMPTEWLTTDTTYESKKDTQQIQIVAFYKKQDGKEQGVTLFRSKEPKLPFKFLSRDKIEDRTLGRGGIEELFDEQTWTNWNEIKITEMLEAASKIINITDDPSVVSSHPSGLKDIDNHEIVKIQDGKKGIWQMDTYPRNLAVFNDALDRWKAHAQELGAASEGLLGESPSSGTPFKLFEAQNILAQGMHKYRQGQIASFMDEIYRDWSLKHVARAINNDHEFLSELSADEMMFVAKRVATNEWNENAKNKILNGELVEEEKDAFIQKEISDFMGDGNKRFVAIVKGEFAENDLDIRTNIVGKQKNLALLTDKLTNVLRQFLAAPQLRQDPEMIKLLNIILESSGMSPIMFGSTPQMQQPVQPGQEQLMPAMAQTNAQ